MQNGLLKAIKKNKTKQNRTENTKEKCDRTQIYFDLYYKIT